MGRLFGTDGIRGLAGKKLTPELALKLGKGIGYLTNEIEGKRGIVLGQDTRISGSMLSDALAAGIMSSGVDVYKLGVFPTPGIAFMTRYLDCSAGVVISASHNPFWDNGIKFFNAEGFKISDEIESRLEEYVLDDSFETPEITGEKIGRIIEVFSPEKIYSDFLKEIVDVDLKGYRILLDLANGASSHIFSKVIHDLGGDVTTLNCDPDGLNINSRCGSTYISDLGKEVVRGSFDLGIAHDGDADRMLAVDKNGEVVDGDQIMAIMGKYLKGEGKLKNNIIVGTVMSNLGMKKFAEENDITFYETNVGDRYVLEKMIEVDASLGGEQSGHLILLDYNTTGDGLLSGLFLLKAIKSLGASIDELTKMVKIYPQILQNYKVEDKAKALNNENLLNEVEKYQKILGDSGRILLRSSGTEELVRIMAEGKDIREIKDIVDHLGKFVK